MYGNGKKKTPKKTKAKDRKPKPPKPAVKPRNKPKRKPKKPNVIKLAVAVFTFSVVDFKANLMIIGTKLAVANPKTNRPIKIR